MLRCYGEATYTDGYQVVTSLDSRLQTAANYALRNGLLALVVPEDQHRWLIDHPGAEITIDLESLRLRAGDAITVFDGTGPEWPATIAGMTKSTVTLELGDGREAGAESPLKIHLVQGISRGERMDFVVQKATELGVKRITPVLTEYGVVKLDDKRATKRREHWEGVAASACEQCGRTRLPLIDAPLPLKAWFGAKPADADIDLVLRPGAARPLSAIDAPQTKVCILIGPEGGRNPGHLVNVRPVTASIPGSFLEIGARTGAGSESRALG